MNKRNYQKDINMNVTSTDASLAQIQAEALAFIVPQDFAFSDAMQEVADTYFSTLKEFLAQEEFTGKAGSLVAIPVAAGTKTRLLVFAGIGKKKHLATEYLESYRRAVGTIIKTVQGKKLKSCALALPDSKLFDIDYASLAQQTTVIASLAEYKYDKYISDEKSKVVKNIELMLVGPAAQQEAINQGIKRGMIIAQSVNDVRHWIDTPPSDLTPVELEGKARQIAKEYGLKITTFNEPEIKKMGMGGLAGVSAGSDQDCKLVILEYKTAKKDAPTLAFVGKGITFDSGGLSLKPAEYMETMKEDMSGAAAVLGAMKALAQLKPDVNIIAVTPLSENMPSGKATKPGDILTFYNGKTAEVKNTDAEGRLVLADALAYVTKEYKPDAIIDLATLTGACAYALGPFFTGMMSQHDDFAHKVEASGKRTGDRVWALPFHDDFKAAIKSPVADISNIGSRRIKAGAITAGFFLQNFVDDTPWVHLDIAGTAFDVPNISYYGPGATGAGVRLLIDLATHWQQPNK